jgi:hypothetical protein
MTAMKLKRKLRELTVGELLELLETPMCHGASDAKLKRVRRLLLKILNTAGWFYNDAEDDEDATTEGDDVAFFALAIAEYAVEGVDEYLANVILGLLGCLTRNIAKESLTPFTRGKFEDLSRVIDSYHDAKETVAAAPTITELGNDQPPPGTLLS